MPPASWTVDVAALLAIQHASSSNLTVLDRAKATRALIGSTLFFVRDERWVSEVFDLVTEIVGRAKVYRAELTLGADVAKLLS